MNGTAVYLTEDQLRLIDSNLEKPKDINTRTYIMLSTKVKRALDFLKRCKEREVKRYAKSNRH